MRKNESIDNFKNWLAGFPVGKPSVKVNGSAFAFAVVAVDFGTPLEPVKLNGEQNQELQAKMKELTTALTGRRNVRVNFDHNNGVYWSSI
jgi:hypothetical protein